MFTFEIGSLVFLMLSQIGM